MRLLFLLIVLAFPVLDLLATARFAQWTGVPMWFWLLTSAVAGLWLMRNERLEFRARTVAAMHGDYPVLRGLIDSSRKMLAGILFIMPGVMSDVVGIILLCLPINQRGGLGPQPATAGRSYRPGDTLDGEWRRE